MAHFVIVQLGRDVSGPWLTLLSASIPLSINSLIELLQVRKEEMPEAIKTLQMMLAITQDSGEVQQLLKVPEGRTGNRILVTGMHKTAALERRKTIASSESKERGTAEFDC
jgi:hypothetical protein